MRAAGISLLCVLVFSAPAFGRGAAGGGIPGFKNHPDDNIGLCTPDNKSQAFWDEGLCKSISELFLEKPCVKELIERIRQRYVGEGKEYDKWKKEHPNEEDKARFDPGGIYCSAKTGADRSTGLVELAKKDPGKFSYFLVQFFQNVAINESDLQVLNREQQGEPNGYMNLRLKDMDDPKYQCGCQTINSSGQEGVSAEGPSPGPLDGHDSIMCGAYMGLYWADKNGTLYGSGKDEKGRVAYDGAAKIFKTLQRDPNQSEKPQPLKYLEHKMSNFCEKSLGGRVGTWDPQLKEDLGAKDLDAPAQQ
jgi:hypothetical protein